MKWIAKLVTAAQAVLLAHLGTARADEVAPPDFTEADRWQAAIAAGTPDALQQYISQHPHGDHLGDAFELIVLNEIEAAKFVPQGGVGDVQLSEARRDQLEMLEHDFDVGPAQSNEEQNGEGESLGPY